MLLQKTLSLYNVMNKPPKFEFKRKLMDEDFLKSVSREKEILAPCIPYQPLFPIHNIFKLDKTELLLKPPQKLRLKNIDSDDTNEIERLKNEIKNLKIENDALKSESREWKKWFHDVDQAVDNFPPVEELEYKVDTNHLIRMLMELQKKLIRSHRRIRSYKKKNEQLERMMNSSECSKMSHERAKNFSDMSSEVCSCQQIHDTMESDNSCQCSSLVQIPSESSKVQSKEEFIKYKLFQKSKEKGYSLKDYVEIKTLKLLAKINQIGEKEILLNNELKEIRENFNVIQDEIEVLRKNGRTTDEKFRSRVIEQKQLARLMYSLNLQNNNFDLNFRNEKDEELQVCGHRKQKYIDSVKLLRQSL